MSAKDNVYILRGKILALLQLSATDPDTLKLPDDKSAFDSSMRKMSRQDEMVDELRTLAMEQNTMLGRIMKFPMADSYALYVITHMKKNVAILKWVDYCDGWQDDRLGLGGPLPLSYVEERIRGEDSISKIFS
jgi:hypothetical protein